MKLSKLEGNLVILLTFQTRAWLVLTTLAQLDAASLALPLATNPSGVRLLAGLAR